MAVPRQPSAAAARQRRPGDSRQAAGRSLQAACLQPAARQASEAWPSAAIRALAAAGGTPSRTRASEGPAETPPAPREAAILLAAAPAAAANRRPVDRLRPEEARPETTQALEPRDWTRAFPRAVWLWTRLAAAAPMAAVTAVAAAAPIAAVTAVAAAAVGSTVARVAQVAAPTTHVPRPELALSCRSEIQSRREPARRTAAAIASSCSNRLWPIHNRSHSWAPCRPVPQP